MTGHINPEVSSPFDDMTDEQKEHEAVKLADVIQKMHDLGVAKPGKVDESGRSSTVSHLMEFREALAHLPWRHNRSSASSSNSLNSSSGSTASTTHQSRQH